LQKTKIIWTNIYRQEMKKIFLKNYIFLLLTCNNWKTYSAYFVVKETTKNDDKKENCQVYG